MARFSLFGCGCFLSWLLYQSIFDTYSCCCYLCCCSQSLLILLLPFNIAIANASTFNFHFCLFYLKLLYFCWTKLTLSDWSYPKLVLKWSSLFDRQNQPARSSQERIECVDHLSTSRSRSLVFIWLSTSPACCLLIVGCWFNLKPIRLCVFAGWSVSHLLVLLLLFNQGDLENYKFKIKLIMRFLHSKLDQTRLAERKRVGEQEQSCRAASYKQMTANSRQHQLQIYVCCLQLINSNVNCFFIFLWI